MFDVFVVGIEDRHTWHVAMWHWIDSRGSVSECLSQDIPHSIHSSYSAVYVAETFQT